jgi:molecular chaperone GrpE
VTAAGNGPDHDDGAARGGEPAAAAAPQEAPAERSALAQRVHDAEERVLRVQAELENFRKRSQREFDDARRYREIDVLRDLLPVLDNVRRAIDASEKTTDLETLRSGFVMTAQQIEKLLDAHGCRRIETEGQVFDPNVHDAILQQPVPGMQAGTIVGVANHGYRLHDRVVRPAQVIVAQQSSGSNT